MVSGTLGRQAEQLYDVFAELVRAYQFRDREEICCHGLSLSQCYTLEALRTQGPLPMGELAGRLCLETSTMTRVVDYLVANRLATRVVDSKDRRVCRARISRHGRSLVSGIRAELIKEHELVLRDVPRESREAVILAMSRLLSVFRERQQRSSADAEPRRRPRRRAG